MFRAQQQQQNNQKYPNPFDEKVTGILIIYPTLMVHVIEVLMKFKANKSFSIFKMLVFI
jgi:hypothetical protein